MDLPKRLGVDFHIGLKDILPTYLEQASALLNASPSVWLIKADVFKTQIRPHLLRPSAAKSTEFARVSPQSLGVVPDRAASIALSQHAIIGLPDLSVPKREPRDAGLASLCHFSEFFEGFDLRLHLAIVPQNDYGPIVDAAPGVGAPPSLANLVERLLRTVPSAEATVWVFEEPSTLAVNFACALLGIGIDSLPQETAAKLIELAQSQRFARPLSRRFDALDPRSVYLDDVFDRDVEHLSKMSGVTLVLRGT